MVCGQAMRYSCHNKQRFATLRPISDVNPKKHGSNILIRNDNNEKWRSFCHVAFPEIESPYILLVLLLWQGKSAYVISFICIKYFI